MEENGYIGMLPHYPVLLKQFNCGAESEGAKGYCSSTLSSSPETNTSITTPLKVFSTSREGVEYYNGCRDINDFPGVEKSSIIQLRAVRVLSSVSQTSPPRGGGQVLEVLSPFLCTHPWGSFLKASSWHPPGTPLRALFLGFPLPL